jgi:outer membrane protein TolC
MILASSWLANAEETTPELSRQPVTLKKAIDYALVHNRTLLAARQDSHVADQRVGQTKADFYPKVDANYTFRKLNEQPFARFSGVGAPGGGSGVKINTAHSETNHWEINLIQPVFTGFGLTAQLNISKMDRKIAEYRLEETRLNVVRDVQHTFLQTLLGERLLQVAGDNVKSLDVHRQNAEAQYQQGLTAQNDVLKAQVALAQAQQQERSTAKQLVMLRSRLNQLLDLDLQTRLDLSEEDIEPHTAAALAELYARAEKRRPEYLVLETSIRQSEEGVTAAKSRYYPRVSLFGQYFREGEDFLAETNEFTNNENGAVGVRVDWNLFEGGKTKAEAMEWRYRQASLEEQRGELKQQIRLQVEDAYEQLKVANANIETARTALEQAEENERMTSLQYREQLVIFLEVLNAQVFVAQSRADYYQALYGYQIAWADLERAVGEDPGPR